jgi:hypothetical protein
MTTVDWRQLGAAGTDRTVLAVDFGAGRHEAGFAELAANLDVDRLFLESVTHPAADDAAPDVGAVVRRWCAEIVDRGLPVETILGFCAGASLACALADSAAQQTGHRPTVILFDPLLAGPRMLANRFLEAVDSVTAAVATGTVSAATTTVRAALNGDNRALASTIKATHREVVASACTNAGLDADLADQLTEHFAGLIDYLALAMSLDPAVLWAPGVIRPTTVLASAGYRHEPPLPPIDQTFDVSRMDFLADARVAKVVSTLLG